MSTAVTTEALNDGAEAPTSKPSSAPTAAAAASAQRSEAELSSHAAWPLCDT